MPCPNCDNIRAHPCHLKYIARAFVARVEGSRTISIVDVPYVEKSIVGSSETGKMLGIGTKRDTFDAKGVVGETGQWSVRRSFFRGRKDQNSRPVSCLRLVSWSSQKYRRSKQRTSPIARYFPSGLREVQVHAFTRSRAAHVFPPGESVSAPPGVPNGVVAALLSRSGAAVVRLRKSEGVFVGVDGSYMAGEGLRGTAVGRAL
jgi:hypothetical protein